MSVQETSRAAYYNDAVPTMGARQQRVYAELLQADNLTNSEIAARLNWPINTVTPRVFELRGVSLVTEDLKRTCRVTGRTAIAWRITKETLF